MPRFCKAGHPSIHPRGPGGNLINSSYISVGYSLSGLAFDYKGNLYVGNNGDGVVWKFGPDGTLISSRFASGGYGAHYMAVPEPSAVALLGSGLAAWALLRPRTHPLAVAGPIRFTLGPLGGSLSG